MFTNLRRLTPFLLVFFFISFIDAGLITQQADARSRGGGRSFRRSAPRRVTPRRSSSRVKTPRSRSGFGRGLAGGLLGGALGSLLFGSMFGMGGNGMGILPMLILGGIGYFMYRRFTAPPRNSGTPGYQPPPARESFSVPPVSPTADPVESGLAEIRQHDRGFDPDHFKEVASDVFFQVQAGWMRRDLASYRHLLGSELAAEYAGHFAEMKQKGFINKLESIAIRKVKIVDAGTENNEDFVTVLFTANLLDYTIDDKTDTLVAGSMTQPVKFAEEWTWARPVGIEEWKLEGIKVVED